jgi:SAM-dependent methyltransferase
VIADWILSDSLLECPTCRGGALAGNGGRLVCASCNDAFPVVGRIGEFQRRFDDYSENYDQICADDVVMPKTPDVVKQRLAELVTPRWRRLVCDLGCGDGYVIRRIASDRRVAVDIAKGYLELLPADVVALWSRVEDVPLRAGSVDTVVCTDVLEHVLDAGALAAEIDRLLAPDGVALLAFPYEQDLGVYELPDYRAKYGKYRYVHLRSIDDELVAGLFPDFEIVSQELITEHMPLMEFKPFAIKFVELLRRR